MAFLTEPDPPRGVALPVLPGVRRVVAENPSVMTYHGTNTYLIDAPDGITVLDPGPAIDAHVDAVAAAGAGRIVRIVVSHTHRDHYGAATALAAATGAPVYGWHISASAQFAADRLLHDGDQVGGLTAVYTPGHAADHLCFAWDNGVLFTADHVMGWASSIVNPPDGNMRDYVDSLALLLSRDDRVYLCGHGPIVTQPHRHTRALLDHRVSRERRIGEAVREAPSDTFTLMDRLYSKVDPMLRAAAERNVVAHLQKLQAEGLVAPDGGIWRWVG